MAIIVMGGSGGLGSAVLRKFMAIDSQCHDWSLPEVDFMDPDCFNRAAEPLQHWVDVVVNCAGVNLLRKFEEVSLADFERGMMINAYAFPRAVQALMKRGTLAPGAMLCNVVSNAARMPMTHSMVYNASKAAQEIITRQMARELKAFCIFGVNPNKLAGTGMSQQIEKEVCALRGWTPEEANRYQLAALPAGVETPVEALAEFIYQITRSYNHAPYITGCIFPYGGPMQ